MTCRSVRTIARHQHSPPRCCGEAEPQLLDQPERLPVSPDQISCCPIRHGTRGARGLAMADSVSRQAHVIAKVNVPEPGSRATTLSLLRSKL